jgi:hypothetical protein
MQVLFLNPLEERLREFLARYLPASEFEVKLPDPEARCRRTSSRLRPASTGTTRSVVS